MKVTVLGCGVSGLTCGIRLLELNFRVKIIAYSIPPNTTSDIAAAYWSPFRVYPEGKVLKWGKHAFNVFMKLTRIEGTGVSRTKLMELFDHDVDDVWWEKAVPNYRRASKEEMPQGFKYAHLVEIPLIETPIYMKYLVKRFKDLGGRIQRLDKKISSIEELYTDNMLIINCSGLGAHEICGDNEVYPIRGQIIRTTNPGINRCYHYESTIKDLTYIVPRSNDCILGGTAEENNWNTEINEETAKTILHHCQKLEPSLLEAEVLEHKVGLRPGRNEVRLELEIVNNNCSVIHNYGHGGAGFTLSWGCAEEVVKTAKTYAN
ncbi:FAD-binding oxidoreductase [Desulfobacterota bacterium AH_259_B03_O07]|nr:FAD-binding oxidoreductase [Desulfobacterota bacterium AH_259_B03_O07]